MEISIYNPQFADALVSAFWTVGELQQLVLFGLGENLAAIVNSNANLRQQVVELLLWAEGRGKVDRLIAAAIQRNPNNPALKRLAGEIAKQILDEQDQIANRAKAQWVADYSSPVADASRQIFATYKPAGGALESFVVGTTGGPNQPSIPSAADWLLKMDESRARVCKILRDGKPVGTGFLIGPARIMTNSHVVGPLALHGYSARFDAPHDCECSLKAEDERSDPRDCDYAIFSLHRIPDGNRGFYRLRDHPFAIREPVSVLGYPMGQLLTFTFGVVFDSNSFMGRIAYTANTAPGSSGSPVFTAAWDLVAIHHHGEVNVNNHGIPMNVILKDLGAKKKLGLVTSG